MIHFISPGEGAELIEKALRSIFTAHDLEWQCFDHLARISRCILDDVVEKPMQLILSGATTEAIWDFYNKPEEPYLPIYADAIGYIPVHYWCIVSPVGRSGKRAREFISKIDNAHFLENFRSTLLIPAKFRNVMIKEIGEQDTMILPDESDVRIADLCYTMPDGNIKYTMMPGKASFATGTRVKKFIENILDELS